MTRRLLSISKQSMKTTLSTTCPNPTSKVISPPWTPVFCHIQIYWPKNIRRFHNIYLSFKPRATALQCMVVVLTSRIMMPSSSRFLISFSKDLKFKITPWFWKWILFAEVRNNMEEWKENICVRNTTLWVLKLWRVSSWTRSVYYFVIGRLLNVKFVNTVNTQTLSKEMHRYGYSNYSDFDSINTNV